MQRHKSILLFVIVLVAVAIAVIIKVPPRLGLDLQGGSQLTIQVKTTDKIKEITPERLQDVLKIIENRVNGLGVSEAVVQTSGDDQISVQLPGVNDPTQAERVLGGTAQLEFRKQKPGTEAQFQIELQIRQQLQAEKAILKAASTSDPEIVKKNQESLNRSNEAIKNLFEVTGFTGKNLRDARATPTSANGWQVSLSFDDEGGQLFADLTKALAGTGRSIGIFLDNFLISYPNVGAEFAAAGITGGGATIFGDFFTAQSSSELSVQLRGGALPLPVEIIENRTVGASLGQDSINNSINAAVGGMLLVLLFMAIYYRLPGVIANCALIIYTILTYAVTVLVGVTLTLPGIAGFILSIGMAVDANVLIFERTREELRDGKTLYRSVESGFYRAFSSILDGNVTTVIACAALFWLGTGLVKGFALTLAIGVVISMFTAITCSRTFMLLLVLGMPSLKQNPQLFAPNVNQIVDKTIKQKAAN